MNRSILAVAIASTVACSTEDHPAAASGSEAGAHRMAASGTPRMIETSAAIGDIAPQKVPVPVSSATLTRTHLNLAAPPKVGPGGDPERGPDSASFACGQVPEHVMACPAYDEAALDAVPGLAELDEACGRWMDLRPDDHRAEAYESAEFEGEMEEKGMKAVVCGGFVAEVADIETGARIEEGGFPTVEMVFAETARMMMDSDQPVEIIYDQAFGYPAYVSGRLPSPDGPSAFKMSYEVFSISDTPERLRSMKLLVGLWSCSDLPASCSRCSRSIPTVLVSPSSISTSTSPSPTIGSSNCEI